MKRNFCSRLSTSVMFASLCWTCSPVSASTLQFIDLGRTTVDQITGIEWLDVAETVNRSYYGIIAELGDSTSLLGGEGWRYATSSDFQRMVADFFDLTNQDWSSHYPGNFSAEVNSDADVASFISLFGDTKWAGALIEGNTDGILGDSRQLAELGRPREQAQGIVTDPYPVGNPAGIIERTWRAADTASANVGSWLIRGDYFPGTEPSAGASSVPEPATITTVGTGITILAATRRKKRPSKSKSKASPNKGSTRMLCKLPLLRTGSARR